MGRPHPINWKSEKNKISTSQSRDIANKGPSSQGCGFSSSHVWMWELDCKKGWVPKNWCFWTVVLEKTLESPLACKEIKPVNLKGNQPLVFIGRTDAEAEAQYFGHLMWRADSLAKTLMLGKIEGKRRRGQHWFNGHELEQAPGVGDRRGSLVCCSPWSRRVRHDWLNWTDWSHALFQP